MNDITKFTKPIIFISIMVTLLCLCIIGLRKSTDKLMEMKAPDNITQGVVIQHEYVNGYSTVFGGYTPPRFRLHVEGTYEYDGETFTGIKYFDVSEEAYNYFKDGDYFNSATFLIEITQAEQDNSNSTVKN